MIRDQQGNSVSGATPEAMALFDEAARAFNLYRGDPIGLLDKASRLAPEFAMALIAKAHLLLTATEPGALMQARALIDRARTMKLSERERSHIAALDLLAHGEWTLAAETLDYHNVRFPHDLVALQVGHLVDFFRGNPKNLRSRIARVLPEWPEDMPGFSILLGMYAFGLEECGDYGAAEDAGRRAVSMEALDCWAHHAVTHVMEMQGRSQDGIGWMIAREPFWSGDDNAFKVHNWWHRALFHLDLGLNDEALAIYDGPVRESRSTVALDLVDASALLWRLSIAGIDVGDRWLELADCWINHADGKTYPFNDWHAVMAFLGAGRIAEVERVTGNLRANAAGYSETARWTRDIALPLVDGFAAFRNEDYAEAAERLFPLRHVVNAFGGSHAQRDVIDWTLIEAAHRGGMKDLARGLANERLAQKPYSRVNFGFLTRSATNVNQTGQAA